MIFSGKILYLDKFFLPMTTPKSNPSKHYKHFRKAVAFAFRKLELCLHCRFRAGSFSGLSTRIQVFTHMQCWPPWSFYPKTVEITCPKLLGNLKKNCNPLENYKKMLTPSEIFLSQPPSEISTWYPLRNSEFQTPFGKSSQQGVWILNGMAQCTLGLYIC
jgi:hypothetical protein